MIPTVTDKEKELLLLIDEAERLCDPIIFDTQEKVDRFASYREARQSLSGKLYVDGNIDLLCGLDLTPRGKALVDKIRAEETKAEEKKQKAKNKNGNLTLSPRSLEAPSAH